MLTLLRGVRLLTLSLLLLILIAKLTYAPAYAQTQESADSNAEDEDDEDEFEDEFGVYEITKTCARDRDDIRTAYKATEQYPSPTGVIDEKNEPLVIFPTRKPERTYHYSIWMKCEDKCIKGNPFRVQRRKAFCHSTFPPGSRQIIGRLEGRLVTLLNEEVLSLYHGSDGGPCERAGIPKEEIERPCREEEPCPVSNEERQAWEQARSDREVERTRMAKELKEAEEMNARRAAEVAEAHKAAAASAPTQPVNECPVRYVLYSIQQGEGFSLRRDVFYRIAVALSQSKYNASYVLVLPPLTSASSPHWHQGIQHAGIEYRDQPVPWSSLIDLARITQETGLMFMEHAEFLTLQRRQTLIAPQSKQAVVDSVLHLCNFNYDTTFFAEQRKAKDENRLYPGSTHPRNQLFEEFACMKDEKPNPTHGFCGNRIPSVIAGKTPTSAATDPNVGLDTIVMNEYGALRLSQARTSSVHCGLSNLNPHIVAPIMEEFTSPAVKTVSIMDSDSNNLALKPVCTSVLSNSQQIYWAGRPHPASLPSNSDDPAAISHRLRDRLLRLGGVEKKMKEMAHTFIREKLQAARAIDNDNSEGYVSAKDAAPTGSAKPYFLSFHIRRGDFKQVHASVVPDFASLAQQIVDAHTKISEASAHGRAEPIFTHSTYLTTGPNRKPRVDLNLKRGLGMNVFISSDMTNEEWKELVAELGRIQTSSKKIQLVRFDINEVTSQLKQHFSEELKIFLEASQKQLPSSSSDNTSSNGPQVVPWTPFHVLLIDSYICQQSMPIHGFMATKHSYVSEMIWSHRRAWKLEDEFAMEKQTVQGGSGKTATEGATATTKSSPNAHQKDEL